MNNIVIGVTRKDLASFMAWPLAPLGLSTYVKNQNRVDQGLDPAGSELPFDVAPYAHSHVAKQMLERLQRDVKEYPLFYFCG